MEQTLAGLGKRRFLLHNVHEDEPVVFNTRWVMSYLAGPLTRDQIKALCSSADRQTATDASPDRTKSDLASSSNAPVLAPAIRQVYLPATGNDLVYYPRILAAVDIGFSSKQHKIDERRDYLFTAEIDDGPVPLDWDRAEPLELDAEQPHRLRGGRCAIRRMSAAGSGGQETTASGKRPSSGGCARASAYDCTRSKKYRMTSTTNETEGEFRIRLQMRPANSAIAAVEKLRKRYGSKATTLENRLLRAEQAIEREQEQSSKKKLDTAISFGTAMLGALLGRKRLTSTTAGRVGTAIRTAGGARKEAGDVDRARQTAEKVKADMTDLERGPRKRDRSTRHVIRRAGRGASKRSLCAPRARISTSR